MPCLRLYWEPRTELLASTPICYKPFMRKWMRDRLKRRKPQSPAEKPSQEPGQEPLQPAYFDAQEPEPANEAPEPETREEAEPAISAASTEEVPASPHASTGQSAPDRTRRRRRRGRGGRGRSQGRGQASPLQPTLMREAEPSTTPAESEAPAAPTRPAPATPQKPKGVVVLAIGLPGSGKSSWFKRHNIRPLSSDVLRDLLFDDPTEQRFQDLVFSNLRSMLKARLIARRPTNYVDATNLTPHERQSWIKLGQDYGYEVQAVFFDVPLEVCLERNHKRERTVADDVMRRMSAKLKAPTFEEGFSKITVVRVKRKE